MICTNESPGSSLSRFRGRKSKNGAKKQPQRGLGVAQLERLRLEEQRKQDSASLYHHHHLLFSSPLSSDDSLVPLAEQQQQRQKQHQPSIVPFCISHDCHSLHTKGGGDDGCAACGSVNCGTAICRMVCAQNVPSFPIPPGFVLGEPPPGGASLLCAKPNYGNTDDSFMEISGMTSTTAMNLGRRLSLEMGIVGSGTDETETALSCLSQSHNLRSPRSSISNTKSPGELSFSKFPPEPDKGDQFMLGESKIQAINARPKCSTFATDGLINQIQARPTQFQDTGTKPEVEPATFFSVMMANPEEGKRDVDLAPNHCCPLPFINRRLFDPPPGQTDATIQRRNLEEAPVAILPSTGLQPMELSSFQSSPINDFWSLGDQISNRKRPWVHTLEPTRNLDNVKGTYVNAIVENDKELEEQCSHETSFLQGAQTPTSTTIYRNSTWKLSVPTVRTSCSVPTSLKEHTLSLLPLSELQFGLLTQPVPLKVCTVSSTLQKDFFSVSPSDSSLLDIRKGCSSYGPFSKNLEAGISSDFLSLGLSTSLSGMHGQVAISNGIHSCQRLSSHGDVEKPKDNFLGISRGSVPSCMEQGEVGTGRLLSMLPTETPSSSSIIDEHCYYYYGPSIQLSMGCPSLACGSTNEAMEQQHLSSTVDLELKLSL